MEHLVSGAGLFAQPAGVENRAATTATPSPPSEVLLHIGSIAITNTIFTAWIVIIILVLFAHFSVRRMKYMPSGVQNFWELVVEMWVGVTERTMGHRRARRFMPLVATAFLFILFSNWFGTLPISYLYIQTPEGDQVPILRSPNSDLNVTAAMAILMIVLCEVFELRLLGVGGYLKGLLIPNPMRWLEIFTRPLSLAFRLFGNVFAGEVLLATILVVAPYVMFVFIALELFVGIIQALIFSMLSLVFLSIATVHEDAHGGHDEDEGAIAEATHGQPV
ncbi:MAG: F0F1 ATP synthase subunit A [Chloroflexi bacterium]|nr:F0F1 ATP synthase subunit A [Chloroflexota bacterium]